MYSYFRRSFVIRKIGLFAAGVLFGTAGIKLLGSRDARKVYAHTAAAVVEDASAEDAKAE